VSSAVRHQVTGHHVFSQQPLQLSLRFHLEAQSLMLDDVLKVSNPETIAFVTGHPQDTAWDK
jgi:hypothetical protein